MSWIQCFSAVCSDISIAYKGCLEVLCGITLCNFIGGYMGENTGINYLNTLPASVKTSSDKQLPPVVAILPPPII